MDAKTELKAKKIISSYLKHEGYPEDCTRGGNTFRGLKLADRKGINDAVLAAGYALVESAMLGVGFAADFCDTDEECIEVLEYGKNRTIYEVSRYLANNTVTNLSSRIPYIRKKNAEKQRVVLAQELAKFYGTTNNT